MLAILATHPVQWQVPVWQALAHDGRIPFEVWFLTEHGVKPTLDVEFGQTFAWDLPLLEGYPHRLLQVRQPARVDSFSGVRLRESLVPLMQRLAVDTLWVNGWQVLAYWQAVRDARRAGSRVWLRGESNDLLPIPRWKAPIKRALLRWYFGHVDEYLYIGSANRRLYEAYGVSPEHLHFAPYAVDNERFARQAADLQPQREAIRNGWNIPADSFCVLFAGKFIPKKRPLDVVRASKLLVSSGSNVHLLFAGDGAMGETLRSECEVTFDSTSYGTVGPSHTGRPTASFVGFLNQNEIAKAYVAADCLVLPSDHGETWGLVVNEGMATGLPCIVSDACGCAEDLVSAVEPSFCFPLGNISALATSIRQVMLAERIGSLWRRRAASFGIEHTVAVARALYSSFNTGAPAPVAA